MRDVACVASVVCGFSTSDPDFVFYGFNIHDMWMKFHTDL
jgi:hypothetical protein